MSEQIEQAQPAEVETEAAAELAALTMQAEKLDGQEPGGMNPAAPDDPGPRTADALQMVIGPLFQILAPNWKVQPGEVAALSEAWAPVMDKYFPGSSLPVELNAAIVTLAVIAPRMKTPRTIEKEQSNDKQDQSGLPDEGGSSEKAGRTNSRRGRK